MKIYGMITSPFLRKVMIAAHELGLSERIELVPTMVRIDAPSPAFSAVNPLLRIPALETDDGEMLIDSTAICDYLDDLAGGGHLVPRSGRARRDELKRHAVANGLAEVTVQWRFEILRPEPLRSRDWMDGFAVKVDAGLRWLDETLPELRPAPLGLGAIAAGTVLTFYDLRFPELAWRQRAPALAEWHAAFEARPSARAFPVAP
ncbi:glutathione S-transferase family protein [Salipiger sp. P9]|uniref:glutathione S-transferase family protein n=1 Tax=Salipiger pentaromativorans TaxID=2943193 RepID=UPI002157AF40|nr:glutathione S-transferase family protein [Salipiger pentaromativorans]MCR8550636.1 glutathione S-transferase family protein [Salipiger pentaromativorans]